MLKFGNHWQHTTVKYMYLIIRKTGKGDPWSVGAKLGNNFGRDKNKSMGEMSLTVSRQK